MSENYARKLCLKISSNNYRFGCFNPKCWWWCFSQCSV